MPTLRIRFPGGRYHATPWGHHVNEGLVEWPPSPWRLVRALIACGYATQGWPELPPVGRRLFEALAGTLPVFRLPPATIAHSRHYMPLAVFDKGREKTTLVFDTWANVGDGELVVRWPCALGEDEQALLAELASNLGYLGRSESWVEARAISDDEPMPDGGDAFPHEEDQRPGIGWEQVPLMAPATPASYAAWRQRMVDSALAAYPLPEGKKRVPAKLVRDREKAVEPYPVDLLDALQRETSWWKQLRWSQPPGSRRVLYWRRQGALEVTTPIAPRRPTAAAVEMMLLALTTPSGRSSALPPIARTLPQGELVHRALVSQVGRGGRVDCPELTGKDERGEPLRGHRHSHLLHVDLDRDGRLDHVLIVSEHVL